MLLNISELDSDRLRLGWRVTNLQMNTILQSFVISSTILHLPPYSSVTYFEFDLKVYKFSNFNLPGIKLTLRGYSVLRYRWVANKAWNYSTYEEETGRKHRYFFYIFKALPSLTNLIIVSEGNHVWAPDIWEYTDKWSMLTAIR